MAIDKDIDPIKTYMQFSKQVRQGKNNRIRYFALHKDESRLDIRSNGDIKPSFCLIIL